MGFSGFGVRALGVWLATSTTLLSAGASPEAPTPFEVSGVQLCKPASPPDEPWAPAASADAHAQVFQIVSGDGSVFRATYAHDAARVTELVRERRMPSKQAIVAAEESLAMFGKSGLKVWTGDDAPWRCSPPASNLKVLAITDGQACTATVRGRTPDGDEVLGGVSVGCTGASDCTLREKLTCMRPDVVPVQQPGTDTKR